MTTFKLTPASEWVALAQAADEIGALADEVDSWIDHVLAHSRPEADTAEQLPVAA